MHWLMQQVQYSTSFEEHLLSFAWAQRLDFPVLSRYFNYWFVPPAGMLAIPKKIHFDFGDLARANYQSNKDMVAI